MVAVNRNSKPDTVLFLDFAAGNDQVDYSQYRTNITNNTTYLSEANSARTALDGPREISIVVDLTNADSGVLIDHGNGATYGYRIDFSGGSVRCRINGTTVLSLAPPSIGAGETKYTVSWNQKPVGGGVYFGELFVCSSSAQAVIQGSYTIFAADPTHTLTVGAANGGGSTFSGGLADIYFVRIGRRFHSTQEAFEDFNTQSTPTAVTGTIRTPPLVPDGDTLPVLVEEDNFVGPSHLWSGHVITQADRRLIGGLGPGTILTTTTAPVALSYLFTAGSPGWWKLAPNDTNLHIGLPWLWYVPVPAQCNRVRCRVQVRQTDPSVGSVTAEVRYRAYSMAGLPMQGEGVGSFAYHRGSQVTSTAEQPSAGLCTALDLGSIGIAVDDWGCTWLAVAVGFKPGDALLATTTMTIISVAFDPYFEPDPLAGLDLAQDE